MANNVFYNSQYPLRLINCVKKYLDAGGTVLVENRIVSQLSKLEILDRFFPSLLIREAPEKQDEAEYNYETCYITAPRKQGALSNWGSLKQKINSVEDCLLGNSRKEQTYKNYTVAHNMLRRASSDLVTKDDLFIRTVSNLQNLYESLSAEGKQTLNSWMEDLISSCFEKETTQICTAVRRDGLSFQPRTYKALISRVSVLYHSQDYKNCWAWMCFGSLLGNYTESLMQKYLPDFTPAARSKTDYGTCRLVSSPSLIAKPFFCGRDAYLERIHDLFFGGSRIVFLYGIDGIGKTEIAKQYALKYRSQYDVIVYALYEHGLKDLVIAETPFETEPPITRLTVNGVEETDEAYFRRKMNLIRKTADERTLIILDNYNVIHDDDLSELLNGRYHLLVTTPYDNYRQFASVRIEEIEDMDALVSIFMNHYQGYAVERDDPDLIRLIQSVRCHTFTVILLALHMENSGQSASEMLEVMNQEGIVSLNERVSVPEGENDEAYLMLIRMFNVFDLSEEEKIVLRLMSLLPLNGMPPMEFKNWAELPSTRVLVSLEKRGWISRTSWGIALHPVVRKVVQYLLPLHTVQLRTFLNNAAATLSGSRTWLFTVTEKERYSLISKSILDTINVIDENTYNFYSSARILFGYSGSADLSVKIGRQLYQYCSEKKGMTSFETARIAYGLGWTYQFHPEMEDAQVYAEEWLTRANELLHQILLNTNDKRKMYCGLQENLSKFYLNRYLRAGNKQDLKDAEKYAENGLACARKWADEYDLSPFSMTGSLLRLADIYMAREKYESASKYIEEAYAILSSLSEDDNHKNPDILRATSRRAIVLYHLDRYSDSLAEAEKNLTACQMFYGDLHSSCFEQLVLIAENYLKLGMTDQAAEAKEKALNIGRKIFHPDSEELRFVDDLNL